MIYNIFPEESIKRSYNEGKESQENITNYDLSFNNSENSFATTKSTLETTYKLVEKLYNNLSPQFKKKDRIILWFSNDSLDFLKFLIFIEKFTNYPISAIDCSREIMVNGVKIHHDSCSSISPDYLDIYEETAYIVTEEAKKNLNKKLKTLDLNWDIFQVTSNREFECISSVMIDEIISSLKKKGMDSATIISTIKYEIGLNINEYTLDFRIKNHNYF